MKYYIIEIRENGVIRLNREGLKVVNFGSGAYSKEEVIAELSNCFLCGFSGIENNTLNNNVAYIKGWLDNMKKDKTFLFKVIREGQESADYILKGCDVKNKPIEEGAENA